MGRKLWNDYFWYLVAIGVMVFAAYAVLTDPYGPLSRAHGAERTDVDRILELVDKHKDTVKDKNVQTIVLRDPLREYDPVDSILIRRGVQSLLTIQGYLWLDGVPCFAVFNDLGPTGVPVLSAARCGKLELDLKRLPKTFVQKWYDERVREALARLAKQG